MVLDGVDERLGVLDAHAHGEGLRLEPHAAARQQLVDVARRVSRSEDDSRRLDAFVAAAHPCEASAAQFEVGHPPLEEELPPGVENRLPDGPHDVGQAVGTDVGVRLVENRGVGAVEDQRLERLAVIAALLAAREELAVGEGPRATLAEGVVRIVVDRPVAVDLRDVALAGRDVAPALENHRTQPQLDEAQRGEEPRGARADDEHLRTAGHRGVVEVDGGGQRLAVDVDLEREVDLGLTLASVDGALDHAHERHLVLRKRKTPGRKRRAEAVVGSLFGRENEGNGLWHNHSVWSTKIGKKRQKTPPLCVICEFFVTFVFRMRIWCNW